MLIICMADIEVLFSRFRLFGWFTPGFAVPVFKPATMLLLSPFGIKINHFHTAIGGKQHAHGIHFSEHFPDLCFGVMLSSVAMGYKVVDKVFFCCIPALSFPTGAGQVIHKIKDHITGWKVHQPAQHEELIGDDKLVCCIPGISARLPFEMGFGLL